MTVEVFIKELGYIIAYTWLVVELLRKCYFVKKFFVKQNPKNMAFIVGLIVTGVGIYCGAITYSSLADIYRIILISGLAIVGSEKAHDVLADPLGL
ncbi:hypothetical protein [Candidatus Oleimmundimicrobium sp.]|uniref:hypothetical protein n=1 Tax=Candidatus Oleimmundimicrobium sp. TaxID=3060597 RepID=UPI002722D83C|nr:hypothetical protein [Candidatus Oleimmundimicrobium sp.]MDO8885761.1 hypothetical protein [Candidatus Oleimmundimicrobium sp.]